MSNYTDADVRALMEALGCQKDWDETSNGAAYCTEHNCGWLSDINACARVERALEEVVPAIVARAKAEALREFAARMESAEWTHRDDWGVRCAYAFEVTDAADEIERGAS